MPQNSLGKILIRMLEYREVEFVFGIPGVHTVELYRALSESNIRHITARHEQGAGFMADGYARVSGKPGVCLVITGPGLTNILTAMAQARSDSIPMLVISGVNKLTNTRNQRSSLHSLPNQTELAKQVATATYTIKKIEDTCSIINKAFTKMMSGKPGPVHIQIPINIMTQRMPEIKDFHAVQKIPTGLKLSEVLSISDAINKSKNPCIILGGGARSAKRNIVKFVETLQAPTISTVNARDLLGLHNLHIPASPSLKSTRNLLYEADLVIALGTELGQTDYDMYEDGFFPFLKNLIRVDIDQEQLMQSPTRAMNVKSDVNKFCNQILKHIKPKQNKRSKKIVEIYKNSAQLEIPQHYKSCELLISTIVKSLPDAIIVGDSTQPTYCGNLYCEITNRNRWFNSATGFGTLGYATPASIGAQLGSAEQPVVCIIGDGGLQFTLGELGTAVDEQVPVLFLVWNNKEYKEIRTFMEAQSITPIGISPTPPRFELIAESYDIEFKNIKKISMLSETLFEFRENPRPLLIEIGENTFEN